MIRKDMFFQGDRYFFDMKQCSPKKGFAQLETSDDTYYFGAWANPKKMEIVQFVEGDVIILQAENEEEFKQCIIDMAKWNTKNGGYFAIDPLYHDNIATTFKLMGLGEYLYKEVGIK